MWKDAAALALGCVLFINMGLSEAIQEFFGIQSRLLSCPKCLTFWTTLAFLLISRCSFVLAVGGSFLFSYSALWADLGLSMLNKIYNELSEQLASPKTRQARRPAKGASRVSEVQGN